MNMQANTEKLNERLSEADSLEEMLSRIIQDTEGRIVFSTSFSKEDQIILDAIARVQLPIECFTLDTGRLFPQTYSVWNRTKEKYGIRIKSFFPDALMVEDMLDAHGPNLFYESVALRKRCCEVRKVQPLKRALEGSTVWITGIRAAQSENRAEMALVEWDAARFLYKINPLLYWSDDDVDAAIRQHNIPYNSLHDQGFLSIGCAPCTRAITAGEPARAGRWWWEDASKKECGLHISH